MSTLPCLQCYFQCLLAIFKASYVGESAASMNEPARTTRVKILQPQTRVSGAVGEFIEDGSRRRKRRRLYGTVLHATSHNRYMVSFDATPTPMVLEVASNSLRVEHATAALPPDIPIPSVVNVPEHLQEMAREVIDEDLQEQQEEEHLPEDTPESEDAEEEGDNNNNNSEEGGADATANTPPDPEGRMPGQLPTQTESAQPDYASLKRLAKEKIKGLVDTEVTCKSGNKTMKWKVIADHEPTDVVHDEVRSLMGLKDFNSKNYLKDEVLCQLFLQLTFCSWKQKVVLFNDAYKKSGLKGRLFTNQEFLTALGFLIVAAEFSQTGKDLLSRGDQKGNCETENWTSLVQHLRFEQLDFACAAFKI